MVDPPQSPPQLTLVVGSEELLATRAVASVVTAAKAIDPECDIREQAASTIAQADLYDLLGPSLFGGRRVVVLAAGDALPKELMEPLTAYANDPADDVHLVLVHPGGARGKAVADVLRKAGAHVFSCDPLTRPEQRMKFVRDEVSRQGGSITQEAAARLLDAVGTDLRALASACKQLVSDSNGQIDERAVGRYHRGRADVTGFAVADRAIVGDEAGALETLRWALSIGVAHVLIADALADSVRSVARFTAAGKGGRPDALAAKLSMPAWKVRRVQSQARGWSPRGLRAALRVVADANADVKGAAADPSYALEVAIRKVAAAHRVL